ncbi:hypothetical protein HY993_03050 [Candidatus Micrarchaeota archaeon]|nr:hypothetical protein [Candidatus Micrarchaeota archaeon]
MPSLRELRYAAVKHGYKNPDLIISMTGFDEKKFGVIPLRLDNDGFSHAIKAVDVIGLEKVKQAISTGVKPEELLNAPIAAASPRALQETTARKPTQRELELEKQAVLIGVRQEDIRSVAKAIGERGLAQVRQAMEKTQMEHRGIVAEAIIKAGVKPVMDLLKKIPEEHKAPVAESISWHATAPVLAALSLKAPMEALPEIARTISVIGLNPVQQAMSLKVTRPDEIDSVSKAIKREGLVPVREVLKEINPRHTNRVAQAISALGADKVREELSNPRQLFSEQVPQLLKINHPKANLPLLETLLNKAIQHMRESNSKKISRKKLKEIGGSKHFGHEIKTALEKKKEYSLDEINSILSRTRASSKALKISERGIELFEAKYEISPFAFIDNKQEGSITLAVYPPKTDLDKLAAQGRKLGGHVEDAIGFARFHIQGKKLIVSNLQTDIGDANLSTSQHDKYKDWHKMLLLGLNEYAARNGAREIWITPAEYQMRRWRGLSAKTAFEAYAKTPSEMNFSLKQTEPMEVEGTKTQLFWVRKVNGGLNDHYKKFRQLLKESHRAK